MTVRSDNAGEYFGAPIHSEASGSIKVMTGSASSSSGDVSILSGKSSAGNSGNIQIETGESPRVSLLYLHIHFICYCDKT